MRDENIRSLERLILFSHVCGIITIFLGIFVIFVDLMAHEYRNVQIGLFIMVVGYTFAKISEKLSKIILAERSGLEYNVVFDEMISPPPDEVEDK